MSYTVKVLDVNGGGWTFTLPDQVTMRQTGSSANVFHLDGTLNYGPLIFDYNLNADLLFNASFHGIISVDMKEDDPSAPPNPDVANGLRGLIGIAFHNNLGFTIHNPPAEQTMAFFAAGISDVFPPPAQPLHSNYTHFHPKMSDLAIDQTEFPGFAVTTTLGPVLSDVNPTNPNWIFLDGTIVPGDYNWGNFTFHRRDSAVSDDTSLNLIFFNGALDPNDIAAPDLVVGTISAPASVSWRQPSKRGEAGRTAASRRKPG